MEEADDRESAFETQPAHVKNMTLKKKFGVAVPGALDPKSTGILQGTFSSVRCSHPLIAQGPRSTRRGTKQRDHYP